MDSVKATENWPVENASAAVVLADGTVAGTSRDVERRFPLASVTKLLTAYSMLVALDEGALELDQPAGPEGSTVRHLLAHSGGYDFGERTVRYEPGTRRLYSNAGFEVLGETLEEATGISMADYLREGVLAPLGMTSTALEGSPAAGAVSTVADLSRFAAELQKPVLTAPGRLTEATAVVFPDCPVCCLALAGRRRTTGAWASKSAIPSPRTGPEPTAPRGRSAISASPGPSCGSTRKPEPQPWP